MHNTIQRSIHGSPLTVLIALFSLLISCESFVDIASPKTELSRAEVFGSDLTAQAAVSSIYVDIASGAGTWTSITSIPGFAADELVPYVPDPDYQQVYDNNISPKNTQVAALWQTAYASIYKANAVLEGLSAAERVTPAVKKQLEGEVRFLRAFQYFYLVNMFGDVPLITTTDYHANRVATQNPATEIYEAIVSDLLIAKEMLAVDFSYSNGERVKPNRWTASALLSRVYLYTGQWAKAEIEATAVIDKSDLFTLTSLDEVFLTNSNESLWQVLPIRENINTETGFNFILVSQPDFATLRDDFIDFFEPADLRLTSWIGNYDDGTSTWYFPYKYKVRDGSDPMLEYEVILRLAEQYLIRAEARVHQDNFEGSIQDLNTIRLRASLSSLDQTNVTYDQPSILLRIEQERRAELFCEWGHRWFDPKRSGRTNAVLQPIKPNWAETKELFPIPDSERLLNPNLGQNPGY